MPNYLQPQYPERIACLNCRDLFRREEIPFPGEGDSCEECEGLTVHEFDCRVCDLNCGTFDDAIDICDDCAAIERRKQRAEDNARDQYDAYCRERYLGISL